MNSIIRGADWVLCEERGEGVPDGIYGVACMSCEAASPLFDDEQTPCGVWALHHTQERPDHTLFLARTERHWRVVRRPEPEDPAAARPTVLDRALGPAFVGLMCLLTAASGYLPLLT
ncbi:hypothetical protein FH609_006690 [Streptomyces sp. 3MP-14]|uniref:DUF7848 domain-containing protein n=1 Tax=Streptomyces mimosae TaxID=2586635 RepID=A0A5N6AP90_9ACTN|nr:MULTISPECIES: hypothetical protein [Streptomyces]KAB8169942.1 hypothetical protein FH607_004370 [Streptomyces mimosae]KAB8178690.1 hypothetical protein FH609_006690 [Streptomyces sp. 3MP-14]